MSRADEIIESDNLWHEEAQENGWTLGSIAPWPMRLPVIRWVRFVVMSIAVHRHASQWASVGIGIGGPNGYDRWRLWAIYRGWA